MGGFFDLNQYDTPKRVRTLPGCGACGLKRGCKSPKMKPYGKGKKKILIVNDIPTKIDDKRGILFTGDSGKYFKKIMKQNGIDVKRDCITINAVHCYAKKDKLSGNKSDKYIEFCRPTNLKIIKKFKPKIIILLGKLALRSIVGHTWQKNIGAIDKWRGYCIPDRTFNAWVCPTFHPRDIRQNNNKAFELYFKKDIRNMLDGLRIKQPVQENEKEYVTRLTGYKNIKRYLIKLYKSKPPIISIDYESTGLKPDKKGHRIVSCSITTDVDNATAFPVLTKIIPYLRRILKDPSIKKIAQNIKFEERWSRVLLGCKVNGWIWDTMLASHQLDNRKAITSLKFQTYVLYGVADYDSHLSEYLKSEKSNGFNRIFEIDPDELLLYNGLDTLWTLRIAFWQMRYYGINKPFIYWSKK